MYATEGRKVLHFREDVLPASARAQLICIIRRDSSAGRSVPDVLEREGFSVRTLSMKTDVVQHVEQLRPSLVIIETTVLSGRALELCREIRWVQSLARTPVIFLSAKASEEEPVLGLEAGADDYITEASSGREIVARVRAAIRRFARQDRQSRVPAISPPFLQSLVGALNPAIRAGEIVIDTTAMRISVRGSEILTTNLEFRLLYYLVHNQARVFTRDQLLDAVWGTQYVELRSVDACVRRLRRKIEPDPLRPTYLRTVRGVGYCLRIGAA